MSEDSPTPLEEALARAATDAAARPEFYRALMEAQVFVLGSMAGTANQRTVEAGENISIAHWQKQDGTPIIPFFASLPALQRAIRVDETYLQLPAKSLFEITRGATLVLNPSSDHGKEFVPHEIDALLDSGMNQIPQRRVVQKETRVLLGQPSNYPTAMVEALSRFYATRSNVRAAYLCLMHEEGEEKAHLVIGIDCDEGYEQLVRETGVVASDSKPKDEPFDIVRVEASDSGISEHFRTATKPFYTRSWRGKLESLFRRDRQ
jgi:hypothetical protein